MTQYEVTQDTFRTPRGATVNMAFRRDTNDFNTLRSCLDEDEYRLRELTLTGTALDVGAYIGGVTIALAIDNPDLHVVAIEAVPPNVVLLRENVERNGVADRVTVLEAAAGGSSKTMVIKWGFAGNEAADHHAFVGNAIMPETTLPEHHRQVVPARSLASLVKEFGQFSFAKVDCEGCEFPFLQGAGLAGVNLIRGEVHFDPAPLMKALVGTHDTTFSHHQPGPFEAVLR